MNRCARSLCYQLRPWFYGSWLKICGGIGLVDQAVAEKGAFPFEGNHAFLEAHNTWVAFERDFCLQVRRCKNVFLQLFNFAQQHGECPSQPFFATKIGIGLESQQLSSPVYGGDSTRICCVKRSSLLPAPCSQAVWPSPLKTRPQRVTLALCSPRSA